MTDPQKPDDPFLIQYNKSELRIASEFLSNWLPFLSRDLCINCKHTLSHRINSLSPMIHDNEESSISEANSEVVTPNNGDVDGDIDHCDTHSIGSWKGSGANGGVESLVRESSPREVDSKLPSILGPPPKVRMSWADMAQEDELEREGESEDSKTDDAINGELGGVEKKKTELSRDQREYLRFKNVRRKKDFICLERVDGKLKNILQGLELHTGVFSAVEQKRIVDNIYDLVEKGKKGELKERTYTAPRKWMKGKGRVTIQFGCCYNYATDKKGNPPGILKHEEVDPLPSLFRVIIKRLIRWHVIPPSCVPDSCIVNIYEEGDCIPPHIDNHDFVRPFCTISFLSECNIVFGTDLKIDGPGEFSGAIAIPLPVGSVMVLNGNGADVAKHCVPAVPSRRISITFRRMDETKRPVYYSPEPDLQGLEPLCYDDAKPKQSFQPSPSPSPSPTPTATPTSTPTPTQHPAGRQGMQGSFRSERKRDEEPRYSARNRIITRGPKPRVNLGGN